MSKKIFKYQLENTHFQKVEMPKGAEILCIQTQRFVYDLLRVNKPKF